MPTIRNYELITEIESSAPPTLSPLAVGNAVTANDALSLAGMLGLGLGSPGLVSSVDDLAGLKAISTATLALIDAGALVLREDTGQLYQYVVASALVSNDHNVVTPTNASGNRWVEINLLPYVISDSSSRALIDQDDFVLADCSGGAKTYTLPTAIGRRGKTFFIKKTDSSINNVIFATTGGQTIDGSSTFSFNHQYRVIGVTSDNANWHITSDYSPKLEGEGAADGDWRVFKSGTSLLVQRRESSTWTSKFEFEA